MSVVIVLLSVLCLATASGEEVRVPWSDLCCYTIGVKWTETMSDGTTNSGIGKLDTFNPTGTVIGKVAAPSKLQTTAIMRRSRTFQYTQMHFVVDIARPSPTTADVTIFSKEYSLYGMYESKELAQPGQVKANKLSIVVESARSRIVFEKEDG